MVDAVPTVLLVRHGRTAANASGTLAGWTPGIGLDDAGPRPGRSPSPSGSPRCPLAAARHQPAATLPRDRRGAARRPGPKGASRPEPLVDDRLGEARYGDWTGRPLKELAKEPLWRVVQAHPSAVTFPGEQGESMLAMQVRARRRRPRARRGRRDGTRRSAVWVAVSHGDVIKSVLADALGMHLDAFQRIVVDPCSVSVSGTPRCARSPCA